MNRIFFRLIACALLMASINSLAGGPEIIPVPPPLPPICSGFFIGIDGGYSASLNSTDLRPDYSVKDDVDYIFFIPNNTTFQRDIRNSGFIGGLIGYHVNNNVAFDVNYDYRGGFKWEILSSLPDVLNIHGAPIDNEIFLANHISIQTVLFNIILNPTVNWGGFTPYVNAGIGLAINKLGTIQNYDLYRSPTPSTYNTLLQGRTTTDFAWNAGVGVDYAVTPRLHANLGYRFVDAGELKSSINFVDTIEKVSGTVTPFKAKNVLLTEFVAGLTYNLNVF